MKKRYIVVWKDTGFGINSFDTEKEAEAFRHDMRLELKTRIVTNEI